MATVFPLFPGFLGYQAIAKAKYLAFLVLCGGYAAVMLLLGLEGLLIGAVKLPSPAEVWKKAALPQKLIVLYAVLTWLSALASPYFPETVRGVSRYEGALTISLYCVCFLLVSVWGQADRTLLAAFAAAAAAFCAVCILQMLGLNPFHLFPEGTNYYDANKLFPGVYIGTIGNADLASAYLCIAVPVCGIGVLRLRGRRRFLLLITLALLLAVLAGLRVAGCILGAGLGALLCLPVVLPAGRRGRILALVLVLAVLLLCAACLYFFDAGGGTLHEFHELLHGRVRDAFGSGRIGIWRAVLERLRGRWLLGWGPDTMLHAEIPPFSNYEEALGGRIVLNIDAAHNEYLNVLFHQGIFALLALLGALIALCARWIRAAGASAAAAILGGAALCWAIQAFFEIGMCITSPFLWLTLALLERYTRQEQLWEEKPICGRS